MKTETKMMDKPLNKNKVGTTFKKLPISLQEYIEENLKVSQTMLDNLTTVIDEWKPQVKGYKPIKVVKFYNGERIVYLVKKGNKILLKNGTKEQASNQVAMYCYKCLKEKGKL